MIRPPRHVLAILSLAAAAGVPVLILLVRLRLVTFRDDYYGFNALGFLITGAVVLLPAGTLLGGLAWWANRRSWLARAAFGINSLLLAGLLWLMITLS